MLEVNPNGIYCSAGDFYIDPWKPVPRAVITHGHSDHARSGCRRYLSAKPGEPILRSRLGSDAEMDLVDYGETRTIGGVGISLHPAGHMLGSAQIRLEYRGQVSVVTGDYKLQSDQTCADWEPVPCDLLVTESTFGLPIYRWPEPDDVQRQINDWWRRSAESGKCAILYGYAVGKSQRLLSGLDASIGPIYTHGAVEKGVEAYRRAGVELPKTQLVSDQPAKHDWAGSMVLAVPSAHGTTWMRRFRVVSTAMASGWMAVRGQRRRRSVDRGFVLSDHVDWPGLMTAIDASRASKIWVTHGTADVVARYLQSSGVDAQVLKTAFQDDVEQETESNERADD
ncbi:MAG: ligase-associated DNA damage response exonuclease [Planctomycetota bacterium]